MDDSQVFNLDTAFGSQAGTQSTEPHQPGHVETFSRQLITHMDLEFKRKIYGKYKYGDLSIFSHGQPVVLCVGCSLLCSVSLQEEKQG